MNLSVCGIEYPVAYTVEAQNTIAKRFDGIENIEKAFDNSDIAKMVDNVAFIASALMSGAEHRERVRCAMFSIECDAKTAPTYEMLCAVMSPSDIKTAMEVIMAAIKAGNRVTVEVQPEKSKNAKATQSK